MVSGSSSDLLHGPQGEHVVCLVRRSAYGTQAEWLVCTVVLGVGYGACSIERRRPQIELVGLADEINPEAVMRARPSS